MDHNNTPDTGMSIYMNSCGCTDDRNRRRPSDITDDADSGDFQRRRPESPSLAMAYVPMQPWERPYPPDTGLSCGTVFPSLKLSFNGKGTGFGYAGCGGGKGGCLR